MSQEQTTPPSSSSPPSPPLDTNFSKKSLLVAYLYWLVGGVFGLHHLYLGRKHAFIVYSTTFGLLFTGTLHDLFVLPRYVEEYNCEHAYKEILKTRIKVRPEPYAGMFSLRYYAQLFVGLVYGGLLSCVLQWWEQELPADLNVHYLFTCKVLFYIGAAVGVYLVGSIGHVREGSLASTLHRGFYAFILCLLLRIGSEGEEDWNSNNLVIVAGCVMGFNASLAYQPEAATPVPLRKAQREEKRLQQGRGCCARQVSMSVRVYV